MRRSDGEGYISWRLMYLRPRQKSSSNIRAAQSRVVIVEAEVVYLVLEKGEEDKKGLPHGQGRQQ